MSFRRHIVSQTLEGIRFNYT